MKSPIILITIVLLFAVNLSAQNNISLISSQPTILYRGFANSFQILINNKLIQDFTIESTDCDSIKIDKINKTCLIYPGEGRTAVLKLFVLSANNEKKIVTELPYRVLNLPDPTLFLGTIKNGDHLSVGALKAMYRLFIKYPPEINFEAEFFIVSWEIFLNGQQFNGTGDVLSDDVKQTFQNVKNGERLTITATITEKNKKIRKLTSTIFIENENED